MRSILKWMNERFPAVNVFSAYLLFALIAATFRYLENGQVQWHLQDLGLGFALLCHFLLLRVIDEHKDYEQDKHLHPERVLQKGTVTLKAIRVVGIFAFVGTILPMYFWAPSLKHAVLLWACVQIWTLLMTFEFFCGNWLRQKLFLYSLSHMFVLPFMILWTYTLAIGPIPFGNNAVILIVLFTFTNGMIYEVTRKTKGREEEQAANLTFTQLWGVQKAALVTLGLLFGSFILFAYAGKRIFDTGWIYFIPGTLTFVLGALTILRFNKMPTAKARKANEGIGALYVLVAYVTYIALAHLRT